MRKHAFFSKGKKSSTALLRNGIKKESTYLVSRLRACESVAALSSFMDTIVRTEKQSQYGACRTSRTADLSGDQFSVRCLETGQHQQR